MRAVDTNVVVRYLTGDEPGQTARVRDAIETGQVYVPTTVLLETERVLRRAYRYGPDEVVGVLRNFAGLPQVRVENAALLTFDRRFIDLAKDASVRLVEP